jgi:hypothetical protein
MAYKKKTKDKTEIKVFNTIITLGEKYKVTPKKDYNAPDGFIAFETTKLLMEGITEERSVPYDDSRKRWDTGFDLDSPCLATLKAEERASLVADYNEHILKPYEEYIGKKITSIDNDFWDEYNISIYTNKIFDTNNPKDLFDLYNAVQQGHLCNIDEKDGTLKLSAKYHIKNITEAISREDEKIKLKAEAEFLMMSMLNDKKAMDVCTILEYNNFKSGLRSLSSDDLKLVILKEFSNKYKGVDNVKSFLDTYKMAQTEKGKETIEIFSYLKELSKHNKLEFRSNQYFYENNYIGNTLKTAASEVQKDPELKAKIILDYTNVVNK